MSGGLCRRVIASRESGLAGLQHDPHVGDNVSSGRRLKTDLSGRPPEQWNKPQNPGAGGRRAGLQMTKHKQALLPDLTVTT